MPETVFIVDDNMVNRKLLAAILKKEGYALLEAEDGEQAVETTFREIPEFDSARHHECPKRMAMKFVSNSRKTAGPPISPSSFCPPKARRKTR